MTEQAIKIDLGCGKHKKEGFIGADCRAFEGVDAVLNLGTDAWPWEDNSVEEAHSSHFVEHLTASERIHFINELYRVLKPGAKAAIITPHWCSNRAYGDLTHQWPPVAEMWFFYLDKNWREINAPHNDAYRCDFLATWGYSFGPDIASRNPEYQQFALSNYKESAQDLHATLVKR